MQSNQLNNRTATFSLQTPLADVIFSNFRLIPIISRFNISFGFGNKTIAEVCDFYDINVHFFLEVINYYHQQQYFPQKELQNYTSKLVVKYLLNTHHYYREVKLPGIKTRIDKMLEALSEVSQFNVKLLGDFFNSYKNELEKHLVEEEKYVFPYAVALEEAAVTGVFDKQLFVQIQQVSIKEYEHNHNQMEITLSDLKNLIIRHLPPLECNELCESLMMELLSLEEDLDIHCLIEEKVLVPKIKMLEKKILADRE